MTYNLTRLPLVIAIAIASSSCAITSECTSCQQHYYRVVDSTNDLPISGVEARLLASGRLPSIGHPMTYTKAVWHRQSNQNGIFSIPERWADEASVDHLGKEGYDRVRVAQLLNSRISETGTLSAPSVLYLTPHSEVRMAELQYLFEESRMYLGYITNYSLRSYTYEIQMISRNYVSAKSLAKTDREKAFNRNFCTLSDAFARLLEANRDSLDDPTKQGAAILFTDCTSK